MATSDPEVDEALKFLRRWEASYAERIEHDGHSWGDKLINRLMRENYARCIRLVEEVNTLRASSGAGAQSARDPADTGADDAR